jgi:hypothetical protein
VKKPFLIALGLSVVAACGGKVVVDAEATSGTGGAGGTSTTISTSDGAPDPMTDVAASTSVSTVASTSITVGSGMSCTTCAQAATDPLANPSNLCPQAAALYNDLAACVCGGACATQCGANACIGQMPSNVCGSCIKDSAQGCGAQLNACLTDI